MVLLDNGGRYSSEVTLLAPPTDLAHVVEHAWIEDGRHAGATDWRVVADTSPHAIAVVSSRGGSRSLRVVLVGARATAATVDVRDRVLTVGLRLRPGTLPLLTKSSARELVDRSAAIENVLGADVLRELELGADAPPDMILSELLRMTRRAAARHTPRSLLVDPSSGVAALSARTSTRALLDRAYRQVGLSPSRALRIARLHGALHAAREGARPWAEIAGEAGYADQAHFCRELRALLGETPTDWRRRGSADSFKTEVCSRR
jgi:AraC-like DNA-binding protein